MRRTIKPFTVEVRGARRPAAATRWSWSAATDGASPTRRDPELDALFAPRAPKVEAQINVVGELANAPEKAAGKTGRILPVLPQAERHGAPLDLGGYAEACPVVVAPDDPVQKLPQPKPKPGLQRDGGAKIRRKRGEANPPPVIAGDADPGPVVVGCDPATLEEASARSRGKRVSKFQTRGDKWKRRLKKWAR